MAFQSELCALHIHFSVGTANSNRLLIMKTDRQRLFDFRMIVIVLTYIVIQWETYKVMLCFIFLNEWTKRMKW